MMEAVRCLGTAARLVSGYIFVPDMDASEIACGGATHAWMQVYLPGAGWVDFDPANNIIGNRNLIRVAVAWCVIAKDHKLAFTLGPKNSWFRLGTQAVVPCVTLTETSIPRNAEAGPRKCPQRRNLLGGWAQRFATALAEALPVHTSSISL